MPVKKVVLGLCVIALMAFSVWLGRVTAIKDIGHTPAGNIVSKAAGSVGELVLHTHEEGKAHEHGKEAEEAGSIKLSSEERSNIGLKTVIADLRPVEQIVRVAGVVKSHPDREAQVSSPVAGKISGLFVKVGDSVQRGQRLAEVQSAEIQKLQVDLIQAENKLPVAKAELERIQSLVESKIAARKELIAAQNQYDTTLNEIRGLEQQLALLGVSQSTVKTTRADKTLASSLVVAPISGVIAERNVVLGESVEPSKVIFKIVDSSVVMVEGDAFEDALPEIKAGQKVRVRVASYPDQTFEGKVSRFSPTIDPEKRTLRLWVEVANRAGRLKPNLFAEMNIVVGGGQEVLTIPLDALIATEGESFVFVEEEGSFRRANVVLGARDDRYVEVKKGLLPGDQVVTDGKQQIYTKSLMARQGGAALGGHTH